MERHYRDTPAGVAEGHDDKAYDATLPPEPGADGVFGETPKKRERQPSLAYTDDEVVIPTVCHDPVRGLIGHRSLTAMYGPSAAGKSFLAVAVAYAVARGEWSNCDRIFDRKIQRRPVLYVCLEGAEGMRHRIKAAREMYGAAGKWLRVLSIPVPLSVRNPDRGQKGMERLLDEIEHVGAIDPDTPPLVIVDTLARAMSGDDENSNADMSAWVELRANELTHRTGVAILVVHHSGKDVAKGMRGASALFAAADAVIALTDQRSIVAEKVKEGKAGQIGSFTLVPVEVGRYEDDDEPITTCTVEISAVTATALPRKDTRKKPTVAENDVFHCIHELEGQNGVGERVKIDAVFDHWVARFRPETTDTSEDKRSRSTFWTLLHRLEDKKWVKCDLPRKPKFVWSIR